jgi:hypothetical protein
MKKESIDDVINDLRSRRDCLSLAHEAIKAKSDQYNKVIIVLSLVTGAIESTKIKMGWNSNAVALIPIFMSSIIGMISALAKFEDNILIDIPRQDLEVGEKREETNGLDITESPKTNRTLPQIKEDMEEL